MVFLDPDNGLIPESPQPYGNGGPQYVTLHEINELTGRGQSVILYQHADRSSSVERVQSLLGTLKTSTGVDGFALIWHRWSVRFYVVLPAPRHDEVLRRRAEDFLAGPWEEHFDRSLILRRSQR